MGGGRRGGSRKSFSHIWGRKRRKGDHDKQESSQKGDSPLGGSFLGGLKTGVTTNES